MFLVLIMLMNFSITLNFDYFLPITVPKMNNPIFDVPKTNRSTVKVMKFGENIMETPTTSSMNIPIKKAGYLPKLCMNDTK